MATVHKAVYYLLGLLLSLATYLLNDLALVRKAFEEDVSKRLSILERSSSKRDSQVEDLRTRVNVFEQFENRNSQRIATIEGRLGLRRQQ